MSPRWHPELPYNKLPLPPEADRLETRLVLKAAAHAREALGRVDMAAAAIPNPTVLINAIPLIETQASSEIENIVTTTDDLFRHAEDEANAEPATKEALRYRSALRTGFELTQQRGLGVSVASRMCSMIQGHDMDLRTLQGTRIGNPITGEVAYSPPEGRELIAEKLAQWERFIHAEDGMDPVVRMAVAHYQFEAIHPFTDGNGRTGRILNILMLTNAGLLQQPLLYLSRYFLQTRADYYRLLLEVTANKAWEEWLVYVLEGVAQTALEATTQIAAIRSLQEEFARQARLISRGTSGSALLALLFEQPYCRISSVMNRCAVSRPTATIWLNSLVQGGLLSEIKSGREKLFINHELLTVLSGR